MAEPRAANIPEGVGLNDAALKRYQQAMTDAAVARRKFDEEHNKPEQVEERQRQAAAVQGIIDARDLSDINGRWNNFNLCPNPEDKGHITLEQTLADAVAGLKVWTEHQIAKLTSQLDRAKASQERDRRRSA